MPTLILLVSLCLCGSTAPARENERQLDWQALQERGCVTQGVVAPADAVTPHASLHVASTGSEEMTFQVLALDDPGVATPRFSLSGTLRHEDVAGRGELAMWAHYPGGQISGVWTGARNGPARAMEGTSGWREFSLLIDAPAEWGPPSRLILNVKLPGQGEVWIGPLSLVDHPMGWWTASGAYAWWIGTALLVIIVLAFEGFLLSLARKGRARTGVTLGMAAALAFGVCLLGAGALAAACGRPGIPPVPTVVAGLLVAATAALCLARARRHYGRHELRRIDAMDAV